MTAPKKKLIRIEKHPKCPGTYSCNIDSGFSMAVLGNTQKTNEEGLEIRQRVVQFSTCREILTTSVRAMADRNNKSLAYSSANQEITEFDFDKLRLLIATNISDNKNMETYRHRLFAGKRALNLLEDYAGWEPKSVISTVMPIEVGNKSEHYWMVTGPKEWITTPQMLSLCTLVLRMAMFCGDRSGVAELNTDSVESMLEHLESLSKDMLESSYTGTRQSRFRTDSEHFQTIKNYILPILKNHKKLFFPDVKDNYPINTHFCGYGGITSYVKCATNHSELTSRFKSVVLKKK